MHTKPGLLLALVLILAEPGLPPAGAWPPSDGVELEWIPGEVEALLVFDKRDLKEAGLWVQFQTEVLFATKMKDRFQDLTARTGLDPARDTDLITLARVRLPDGSKGLVGVLKGSFAERWQKSLGLAGQKNRQRRGQQLRVFSASEQHRQETALALLDENHLVFGDVPLVEQAIDRHRDPSSKRAIQNLRVKPLLDNVPSSAHAWGILLPEWFEFRTDPQELPLTQIKGRSLGGSLQGIRWVTFSAFISAEIRFSMQTQAKDEVDAGWLADALRSYLASVRMGASGPAEVRKVVEEARIQVRQADIVLSMDLSAQAMERIRNNDSSTKLFSWRLGQEERELQERAGKIVDLMEVNDGTHLADIGSGMGFFTVRLARAAGDSGRVYAVDIDEKVLAELRQRVHAAPFANVEVVRGEPDDPRLPEGTLDAVLIVNSYHEMPQHQKILEHIYRALKPGGRFLLVEPWSPSRRGEPRESQVKNHIIAPELVEADLRQAGFEVRLRDDHFVENQKSGSLEWLILANRPQR